jgi:hypothetical protein
MNSLRSLLYFFARLLGDINAIRRGPTAVLKRVGRRVAGREAGKVINKVFR